MSLFYFHCICVLSVQMSVLKMDKDLINLLTYKGLVGRILAWKKNEKKFWAWFANFLTIRINVDIVTVDLCMHSFVLLYLRGHADIYLINSMKSVRSRELLFQEISRISFKKLMTMMTIPSAFTFFHAFSWTFTKHWNRTSDVWILIL